jgi:hypothetical protein
MLTAVTAMLGLMPIVLGVSLDVTNFAIQEGGSSVELWGPMANAVVAGLLVATILTLLVVPVLFSGFDGLRVRYATRAARKELKRSERETRRARKAEERAEAKAPPPKAEPEPAA